MREQERLGTLRRELQRHGIWGQRAQRLLEEWSDHVRDDAAGRVAEGALPAVAEAASWQALGESHLLAAHAARELNSASWAGRHPWIAGLFLPACGCLGLSTMIVLSGCCLHSLAYDASGNFVGWNMMLCWKYTFNWLPLLASGVWLAWMARRMPGGWKLFWISAITLTFCSTTWQMVLVPPLHGPGSGSLTVTGHGVLGLLAGGVGALLKPEWLPNNFWRDEVMDLHLWFQLAVMLLPLVLRRSGVMARLSSKPDTSERQTEASPG